MLSGEGLNDFIRRQRARREERELPLLIKIFPFPFAKGKGIKGIGIIKNYA